MIEDLGGADVCFGALGWSGHIAFIDPGSPEFYAKPWKSFLQWVQELLH